jgi:peptidoglycan hydrolase-like protein with peptidoglycan-binding domain
MVYRSPFDFETPRRGQRRKPRPISYSARRAVRRAGVAYNPSIKRTTVLPWAKRVRYPNSIWGKLPLSKRIFPLPFLIPPLVVRPPIDGLRPPADGTAKPPRFPQPGTTEPQPDEPQASSGGAPADGSLAEPQPNTEPPPPVNGDEFIRWVQSTLNQVGGADLPVDGIMSLDTRRALAAFQTSLGLPADGIVGPETRQALQDARLGQSGKGNSSAVRDAAEPDEPSDQEAFDPFSYPARWQAEAWETEVSRNSSAYIRWVQNALNRILGLRLEVDGIKGTKTRQAVRQFQQSRGLKVDGDVGTNTERALIAAGAGQPPGTAATSPVLSNPTPSTTTSSNDQILRQNIVSLAKQEAQRWRNGTLKENNSSMHPVLRTYWQKGVGYLPSKPNWWSSVPWSAAFISYVIRQAGAGNAFRYSAGHSYYIVAAKNNRLTNNNNPFKAYRVSEVKAVPGDIVCKRRAGSGATYENIKEGMATHCDIVVEVHPRKLVTIGGNVSHSVSFTEVTTDANGFINKPDYFAVIKVGMGSGQLPGFAPAPSATVADSGRMSGSQVGSGMSSSPRSGIPPVEGPYKGITGEICRNGRGKCWKKHVFDIIDEDAPWNDPSKRSPANYAAALDYLNVDNPKNYRYAPANNRTYCNIYAHDATRLMWASVPHWIRDASGPNGWRELGANATYAWMLKNSRSIGWVPIDARMCDWIKEQANRQQSLPFQDSSIPGQILSAGSQISSIPHPIPSLLSQPSYIAQKFANLGLPTLIIWKNPNPGRSGHMAMVRPESSSLVGQVNRKTGIFAPRSAQAGSRNYRNEPANWMTTRPWSDGVMFYVHA